MTDIADVMDVFDGPEQKCVPLTAETIRTVNPARRPHVWEFPKYAHLEDATRRFFEILDIKEESSFGREFHPNRINIKDRKIDSCRVYNSAELADLIKQMKILSGYLPEVTE